jgi:hypothetical protein
MIELLVRPFLTPLVISTSRIPVLMTKIPPEVATLTWGAAGTVAPATQDLPGMGGVGFKLEQCDLTLREEERNYEIVRVHQVLPNGTNDPNNYIDVERVVSISYKTIAQRKSPGSFASETTVFSEINLGNAFATVKATDSCKNVYTLTNPDTPNAVVIGTGKFAAP